MSISAGYLVLIGLGCFLLGAVLTALLLLRVPKFYRMLREIKCPRCSMCRKTSEKEPTSGEVIDDLPYAMTDLSFRELEGRDNQDNCTTETEEKKRYQEFQSQSRKNFHKYTPFQVNTKGSYQTEKDVPNEGYEYMHVRKDKNYQDKDVLKPDGYHQYFILEPETKQPMSNIRRVNEEEELQYHNPNHIYFILDPNARKLKPIDSSEETPERMPDHVYFVLEKENPGQYMATDTPGHDTN